MTVGGLSLLAAAIATIYLNEHLPKMVRRRPYRA